MHILFANTGVQIVCIPLQSGRRYTTAQIGYGWQNCRCKSAEADEDRDEDEEPEVDAYPYIQWQIIQSHVSKLFLAVDTSLGDPDVGYFSDPSSLAGDFHVTLNNLLDRNGQPLPGLPPTELCLRAATATAGEAKPVHMVVDFGNSRTGALLVEMAGEVSQSAEMLPFELSNRYSLDHFAEDGEQISKPGSRWFSSKTRWANTPYPDPPEMAKKEYYRETKKSLFGKKQVKRERETYIRPPLFDDWSMVRMGREVDEISQIMHAKGDFRTGVSSPKRYLWADDASWLEGAFWYMA
ncbi:MAG: virulence factor SrfB, partial [Planctomycetes bacterium]|nr:virulence factor SrfB [Planctomycetota bacterium]